MENKTKLQVGEQYLSIRIVGHADVVAFKNPKKKENPKAPDFKSDGVAVWVNKKKPEQNDAVDEETVL